MKKILGVVLVGVCLSCYAVPATLVRTEWVITVTGKTALKCTYSAGFGSEASILLTKRDQYGTIGPCPVTIEVE
jgi:hypothetical protein